MVCSFGSIDKLTSAGDFVATTVVSIEEFCDEISDQLFLDVCEPASLLVRDLGLDSLALLIVCLIVDEAGGEVPPDLDLASASVGDVYHYLALSRERNPDGTSQPV